MPAKRISKRIESTPRRWPGDLDRAQRSPHSANALEPGVPGEIVASRQGHRRRRLKTRANADRGALSKAGRLVLLRHRHPDSRWKSAPHWRECQPEIAFRGTRLDLFDIGFKGDHGRPIQRRGRHRAASPPDQGAARGHRQAAEEQRPANSSAAENKPRRTEPQSQGDERKPLAGARHR